MVLLLAVLTATACGGEKRPSPADLVGPGVTPVTQTDLAAGIAVLGLRSNGEAVVAAWTEGGAQETFVGKGAPSSPVIGWIRGQAIVGGYSGDPKAERAELITENGKAYRGTMTKGGYLFVWPANSLPERFVLRILDKQGNELFRWPPLGLPAA